MQYDEQICGVGNMSNRPNLYYPLVGLPEFENLDGPELTSTDQLAGALFNLGTGTPNMDYAICVNGCPVNGFGSDLFSPSDLEYYKEGAGLACTQADGKYTCWMS